MARQTVIRHFVFGMAVHAPIHRHIHPWLGGGSLAFSDIPMAGLTLQFSQNHMPPMGKENMIGFPVNPLPGNLFSFFSKLPDLLFFWILCDGFFVALHANINIRRSGKVLGFEITVTSVTV